MLFGCHGLSIFILFFVKLSAGQNAIESEESVMIRDMLLPWIFDESSSVVLPSAVVAFLILLYYNLPALPPLQKLYY